jgi:hypothetical protein
MAAGNPIGVFALIDGYPLDELPANASGLTVMVGIRAIDVWQGITKVTFKFWEADGTTPKSVTVGATTAATHDVTTPTYTDISGYGSSGYYWLVNVNKTDLPTSGTVSTRVSFTITTGDAVEHDFILTAKTRSLRLKTSSPTIIYVDTSNSTGLASDANSGLTRLLPKLTYEGGATSADATASTTADYIYVINDQAADANLSITVGGTVETNASRVKFVIVKPDPSNTSDGTITFTAATRVVHREWMGWKNVRYAWTGGDIALEEESAQGGHNFFEDCDFVFADRTASIQTEGAGWVGVVGCTFEGGDAAIVLGEDATPSGDDHKYCWISANTYTTKAGTCIRNQYSHTLIELWTVSGAARDASFVYNSHFEFSQISPVSSSVRSYCIYADNVIYNCGRAVTGITATTAATWTAATRRVGKTGHFGSAVIGQQFSIKSAADGVYDSGQLVTITAVNADYVEVTELAYVADKSDIEVHIHNYSLHVIIGDTRHFAWFGNRYAADQSSQLILTYKDGNGADPDLDVTNHQWCGNTLIATDGATTRGVQFGSTGNLVGYTGPIAFLNNVIPNIGQQTTGVSGSNPITNITGEYFERSNAVAQTDGSLALHASTIVTAGNPWSNAYDVNSPSTGDFGLGPTSTLIEAAIASDQRYDPVGTELANDGTDAIGAVQLVPAPTNLTATAVSSSQINLLWDQYNAFASESESITVKRSTSSDMSGATEVETDIDLNETTYSDTGLSAGTTYYYTIEVDGESGGSEPSDIASATTSSDTSSTAPPLTGTLQGGLRRGLLRGLLQH